MLLRRIIAHFRKQEWTAIGIDFLIVVAGVFVATQVTDWNNARLAKQDYRRALERLNMEITANIRLIDTAVPEVEASLQTAHHALDVLQSCRDSAANREAINAGLNEIRGTSGLRLRTRALEALVTDPALLAQQSEAERQHFSALRDYLELTAQELTFAEVQPLAYRLENNPILRFGPLETSSFTYSGVEYQRPQRRIMLSIPVSQACRNTELHAAFFNWTRWQTIIPIFSRQAQRELEATQAFLAERR